MPNFKNKNKILDPLKFLLSKLLNNLEEILYNYLKLSTFTFSFEKTLLANHRSNVSDTEMVILKKKKNYIRTSINSFMAQHIGS